MYAVTDQGARKNNLVTDYVCDTRDDIQSLPKHPEVAFGTSALVADGSVWVLFPKNEYVEI